MRKAAIGSTDSSRTCLCLCNRAVACAAHLAACSARSRSRSRIFARRASRSFFALSRFNALLIPFSSRRQLSSFRLASLQTPTNFCHGFSSWHRFKAKMASAQCGCSFTVSSGCMPGPPAPRPRPGSILSTSCDAFERFGTRAKRSRVEVDWTDGADGARVGWHWTWQAHAHRQGSAWESHLEGLYMHWSGKKYK